MGEKPPPGLTEHSNRGTPVNFACLSTPALFQGEKVAYSMPASLSCSWTASLRIICKNKQQRNKRKRRKKRPRDDSSSEKDMA